MDKQYPPSEGSVPIVFQGNYSLYPREKSKYKYYEGALKELLPLIGTDIDKIVLLQVIIVLKLEGLIGRDISDTEEDVIRIISDSVLESPEKKDEAMMIAKNFLE